MMKVQFAIVLALGLNTAVGLAHPIDEARKKSYTTDVTESRRFLKSIVTQNNPSKGHRLAYSGTVTTPSTKSTIPPWVKQTLIDMTNINSGSRNPAGLEAMRAKVIPLFTALGFQVQTLDVGEDTDTAGAKFQRKILVFDFPGAKPDVLVLGHLDTVFETSSPFQTFTEDGDLWKGPGVADMKGGIILAAHVLGELNDPNQLKRVRIIINDDEEQGSPISGSTLKKYADLASYALIFEAPSDADFTSSHSGIYWFDTTVRGVASHAGLAHADGVNACLENSFKMIELYKLVDYSRGFTLNAGIVNTAPYAKANITCDKINTTYDIRYIDTADVDNALIQFNKVMSQNFAPNTKGATVPASTVSVSHHYPSMPPDRTKLLANIYERAGQSIGMNVVGKHKGAVDAYGIIDSSIQLLSGLGPYGGGMHSDKEFLQSDLYLRKLNLNVAFLKELLK